MSTLETRREQMFPKLSPEEIDRLRRFGTVRRYRAGEALYRTGEIGPGMFVIISGYVSLTRREGLGRVLPILEEGPGDFLAEVGQLSGRPSFVDAHAITDVETVLVPTDRLRALLIADAELGERIMRALILRRVALVETGAGGPVLIGPPGSPDVVRLQGFLARNAWPHQVLDPAEDRDAAALLERYAPRPSDLPLVVCTDGSVLKNPREGELADCLGMVRIDHPNRTYDVAVVGAGPGGGPGRGRRFWAPRHPEARGVGGRGRLVLAPPHGGSPVPAATRRARRRRQLGRPGRGVPPPPRREGVDARSRRRSRRDHVALPHRPDRGHAEHRGPDPDGSRGADRRARLAPGARALAAHHDGRGDRAADPQPLPVRGRRSRDAVAAGLRRRAGRQRLRSHGIGRWPVPAVAAGIERPRRVRGGRRPLGIRQAGGRGDRRGGGGGGATPHGARGDSDGRALRARGAATQWARLRLRSAAARWRGRGADAGP